MTQLSVNINKIATLRNARGEDKPNLLQTALDCERFGAQGITVHPRPDERHITRADVLTLRPALHTEFNIEGYPSQEFMELVLRVKPEQVTLVPDAPDAITSSAGWNVIDNMEFLSEIVDKLREAGIRSSIFIDANPAQVSAAAKAGADRVELYTKPYADNYPTNPESAVAPYVEAARQARKCGLGLNAGHDLSLENLRFFAERVPHLNEVSIGHALICDALYLGLEETIKRYRGALGVRS
ncbi:MAG: pyridoxine 5'-phosphate synthase [Bacteroides sp.]|nr:pyridoxine 5'-phosphate synthase [Bacteroides sp.]MCM1379424.1 pyridoxine 5'-phosphate synthase [Bacteroides sp.]MCM1445284.1 pyridoxine 5'-phosphate synthase [Prevotella sp.]